jgi:hypothetical protein
MDGDCDGGTVEFVSSSIRYHVMGHFVLNCLKSDEDYENYINMSSVDSLLEYCRTWSYEAEGELFFHLPMRMEDFFFMRLGIDAIRSIMMERSMDLNVDEKVVFIRQRVSELCEYFYIDYMCNVCHIRHPRYSFGA